eukprot:TRINITY_DN8435_c0_g1_i5.p1 TRINITY_DN8435_c0_g1~~TRINITY_DN8435_c0_g1_i5.p1  ORF type:complete len:223 (-),score=35.54 TRINITY_DN8435_c0_g1_i5:250-918(-)
MDKILKSVIEKVETRFGAKGVDMNKIFQLLDATVCAEYLNYEPIIPQNDTLYKEIRIASGLYFTAQNQKTEKQNKMPPSYFFKELRYYLKKVAQGEIPTKFFAMGSHDVNINIILTALGYTNPDCMLENAKKGLIESSDCLAPPGSIPFASNVILELWKKGNGSHYVTFAYNDKRISPCRNQELTCSIDDFVKVLENHMLNRDDYQEICGRVPSRTEYPDDS